MALSTPRVTLAALPTPLHRRRRLERALTPARFRQARRPDRLRVAGNKARALEYLSAMRWPGVRRLRRGRQPGSNFCAAAAVAAAGRRPGLRPAVPGRAADPVGERRARPGRGARLLSVPPTPRAARRRGRERADELRRARPASVRRAAGRRDAVGRLGFAVAATSSSAQCDGAGLAPRTSWWPPAPAAPWPACSPVASVGLPWRVVGASVSRPARGRGRQVLASPECARRLRLARDPPPRRRRRRRRGAGFGVARPRTGSAPDSRSSTRGCCSTTTTGEGADAVAERCWPRIPTARSSSGTPGASPRHSTATGRGARLVTPHDPTQRAARRSARRRSWSRAGSRWRTPTRRSCTTASTSPTSPTCWTCPPRDHPRRRPRATCSRLLLEVQQIAAEDFPYDPAFGEPYNSRERYFVERLGDVAGWLHAGRPRREAARIALRLHVRGQLPSSSPRPRRSPGHHRAGRLGTWTR